MDFLSPDIQTYCEQHSQPEDHLLAKINRDTHAYMIQHRMISGHLQGRLLSMLAHMVKPKVILEIGTFTGYATLCLAEGLQPDGRIITLEVNEELEDRVRKYFEQSAYADRIDFRIGDAGSIIPMLDEQFDLVFIDADKLSYSKYFDLVIDKVRPGGFILADNVLWSGKVVETPSQPDKDTAAIINFNKKVHESDQVENVLFPVRDGIMVLRKL